MAVRITVPNLSILLSSGYRVDTKSTWNNSPNICDTLPAKESKEMFVTHSTLSNSDEKLLKVLNSTGILEKVPSINTNGNINKAKA